LDPIVRLLLGLFVPQLVLFAAITEFIRAWVITHRVNAAAERCHGLSGPKVLEVDSAGKGVGRWRSLLDLVRLGGLGTRLVEMGPRCRVVWQRVAGWLFVKKPLRYELVSHNIILSFYTSANVTYNTQTNIAHPCTFERWTIAHGFFVVMGGLTIELPPNEDDHSSAENQQAIGTASVDTSRILQLIDQEARFDLFKHMTTAQINQVREATSNSVLFLIAKLLYFAAMVIRRRGLGYTVTPLEVLTTSHIFLTLCIMAFWWHKPPYLREGIALSQQALLAEFEDLAEELDAHRKGTKFNFSYTRPPYFGLRPWHRQDDNGLTREEANYRALALFPICFCHAGVSVLPFWRLTFPSEMERQLWQSIVFYSCGLASVITILAITDSVVRVMVTRWPWFEDIWTKTKANKSHSRNTQWLRDRINDALYFVVVPPLVSIAVLLGLAAAAFRNAPDGVYVAGPGDLYRRNGTYGIVWS
jgi:hypothetical protein